MIDDRVYVRPEGLIHGPAAARAVRAGIALPLLGRRMAFTLAEIFHRCGATGEVSRRLTGIDTLRRTAETNPRLAAALRDLAAEPAMPGGLPSRRALIMGIVNVTPDSFSDGGRLTTVNEAVAHGRALAEAGADILDVGGESTRPGADEVPEEEEMARILPVIESLAADGFTVSVDTRKPRVMKAAIAAGATIINDVAALSYNAEAAAVAARLDVPVVLMHSRGTPVNPDDPCEYDHLLPDVFDWLERAMAKAINAGVRRENIILDPGIGFGKTCIQNLQLIAALALFHQLGRPLLLGASRKRFIGAVTSVSAAHARLAGSLAVAQEGLRQGAQIIRVHDVAETAQMMRMVRALESGDCG